MTSDQKIERLHEIRDAFPGRSAAAQRTRIQEALREFPVTTFEAMRHLDCFDPRPRVLELRRGGAWIITNRIRIETESGDSHTIGQYVLMASTKRGRSDGGAV